MKMSPHTKMVNKTPIILQQVIPKQLIFQEFEGGEEEDNSVEVEEVEVKKPALSPDEERLRPVIESILTELKKKDL